MRNQPPQLSPKITIQPTLHQKKQQYHQFFTELFQKNQSLVQILEQSTYDYPQVNLEKLRSNSSFRQLPSRDSNANFNNFKILNPIDAHKLKDILFPNTKPKKENQIDAQMSQRISPKYNITHLTDLLSVNKQQLHSKNTKKPQPNIELYNQYRVQEKNLQLTNQLIKKFQKENKNLDIETPRFCGMA